MSFGLLNFAMLAGLAGVSIPVIVHLLNRRRVVLVDWGAMQFLELGRRAKRRFQLTELLLMLGRMLLLALVALALARPYLSPRVEATTGAGAGAGGGFGIGSERRDVVLILDGSDSMARKSGAGDSTLRDLALRWAGDFAARLGPGDSVAVLVAKDRVKPLIDPPTFDRSKVPAALAEAPAARGSSDLPAALADAFRILERAGNPTRDVIILTDGQRFAWRPGEPARWDLLRELRRRLPVPPRIWAVNFRPDANAGKAGGPNASLAPLELSRGLIAPNSPITVTTHVANSGPGPLTRTAELLIDGQVVLGSAQVVGPIPAGGKAPLTLRATIAAPGSHALTVRLTGEADPIPNDDEAARAVEVTAALPVLLVDGEPGREPLSGETDFLRAALAPSEADTPQVRATVVPAADFGPESLKGQRVAVLANIDRLTATQVDAVREFLGRGGGVLVAPGDRTDAGFANETLHQDGNGWLPARLGELKGTEKSRGEAVAHPAPRTFSGPALAMFGQGDDPPLAAARFFAYRVLTPTTRPPAAAVTARLDTGDPWIVERPYRKGRVALLSTPIDAEWGTLPVNPDFVPWAHELIFALADASGASRMLRPGEPIVIPLDRPPAGDATTLAVRMPGGTSARASIVKTEGGPTQAQARFDDTTEPGMYRIALPEPPGGAAYVAIAADDREADLAPLEPAEAAKLAEGWPLTIDSDPDRLVRRLIAVSVGGKQEIWRWLVLAALAGLCVEVWLTRRLTRGRGVVATE